MSEDGTRIAYEDLHRLVSGIFKAHGLAPDDADRVADGLLYADLRGVVSHGVNRVPNYVHRIREKVLNPTPSLAVEEATPAVIRIDGDNGMGFLVGRKAMNEAISRARNYGVGLALAYRSNHFGMSAIYLQQAVDAGMAAMVMTNASPAMPVWGARAAFLGTSPFGLTVPGGKVPLILDMATSVAARGKIRRAAKRGESIPADWALDEDGRPTTDPQAADRGIVLPFAGPKGSGLSLLMEAMAGVASGAAFGGEVANPYKELDRPQGTGHLFFAFRPDLFMSAEEYRSRMDALVDRAKASPLAEGFEEILMPGEKESRMAVERREKGLVIPKEDLEILSAVAASTGVPGL